MIRSTGTLHKTIQTHTKFIKHTTQLPLKNKKKLKRLKLTLASEMGFQLVSGILAYFTPVLE